MSQAWASNRKKGLITFFCASIAVLILAQASSFLVETRIEQGHSLRIFSWLHFTHIRNMGGIFGILQGKGWLFTTMSLIVLMGLMWFVARIQGMRMFEYACYGMIVGGGMSNILDRLIYGSVVDFIDVRGIAYWKYIFNTADVMIHLGIWPLVLFSILEARRQNVAKIKVSAES